MSYILLYFNSSLNLDVTMLDNLKKCIMFFRENLVRKRVLQLNIYIILAGLMLYILNETVLKVWLKWSWIHNYLNDCIAGVVFLACSRIVLLSSHPGKFSLVFSLELILSAGVFWECITPFYCASSVTDGFDMIAYTVGGWIWYGCTNFIEEKNIGKTKGKNKMICKQCGNEMQEGMKFCPNCGAEVRIEDTKLEDTTSGNAQPENVQPENVQIEKKEIKVCPKCGQEVSETAVFCRNCGTKLNVAANTNSGSELKAAVERTLNHPHKKLKWNLCLLISFAIGVLYIIYSLFYWFGVGAGSSDVWEAMGAGVATLLVLPHLLAVLLAVIFNGVAVFMNKKGFALTGAILYSVALVLFLPYFMFVIIEMILSYIGYAQMVKKGKD